MNTEQLKANEIFLELNDYQKFVLADQFNLHEKYRMKKMWYADTILIQDHQLTAIGYALGGLCAKCG